MAALAGVVVGLWHLSKQTPAPNPTSVQQSSVPQFGSLLPDGQQVELKGQAVCAYCFWNEGTSCHTTLKLETPPGAVFFHPNDKLAALEKITGVCADGTITLSVRGTTSRYQGRNYLLLKQVDVLASR